MRASSRRLGLLVGAALLAPVTVLADYKTYARGQDAAERQDWSEVESAMQEALASNPQPKVRVKLYGQRFAPYVPQYYLGLAAYRQEDCTAALRWLNDPAAAAVIAELPAFQAVADAARGDCNRKLAGASPPSPPATAAAPAASSAPAVAAAPATPAASPSAGVTRPVAPPPPPQPPATAASSAPALPAALDAAVRFWLSGRYHDLVAAPVVAGLSGRALAHLHLLRAAAFHALSELEVAQSAAHRDRAGQEIRSARQALPEITVDATFYSPRFRAFCSGIR